MPLATKSPTGELDSDTVLREEANTIHPAKPPIADSVKGADLYKALHGRNATALCLSGGGIRSASFALGVIEALAVHPRQATAEGEGEKQAASEKASFLAQFHYLSTVSGGGYIGSWLSAWIARDSYSDVWSKLIGRRAHPDEEPGEIAWLRAYSNYLTPKLGLFSADTWTAVALYVRNLILNWLVILPAICVLLFAIKFTTVLAYWLSTKPDCQFALMIVAIFLMIWTLRFATRNRPTCNPLGAAAQPAVDAQDAADKRTSDAHRNELMRMAAGANQGTFFWLCLLPAILASNIFSIYLSSKDFAIAGKPVWYFLVAGIVSGLVLYAVSWLTALPFKTAREKRGHVYWLRDLACWSIGGGGVYGALMGLGAYLFLNHDLRFLIGRIDVSEDTANLLILAIYGVPWIINAQLTAEMVFVGLTSWQRGSDSDREWFGRSTGWFAAAAIVWFAVAFAILVGAELAWQYVVDTYAKYVTGGIGALSGILTAVFGAGKASGGTEQKDAKASLTSKIVLTIAPAVFLIILVVGLSLLLDYLLLGYALIESPLLGAGGDYHDDLKWLAIGCGATLFVAFFSWTRVNINRFSMHALYRNRLVRAYLGASNPSRAPNPFTGFDEVDNYPMRKLWTKGKDGWQPFHVVNIALNVVASSRLAWQERKAEPFTATPLHCGTATFSGTTAHSLGYRRTGDYASRTGGLTLGTALAISGAAASPNMGYNSSPMVTLLLALFNVRLGWWLGNPGAPGEATYQTEGPRVAIMPYVFEMFGQTTDTRRYVYLSDGGHFENLGLYEMIRRRCRCIVVSDAGCDPEYGFEDLGNAVRKIAIDLGVYITFDTLKELKPRSKDGSVVDNVYYAVGEIDYKTAPEWKSGGNPDNGLILYIKPGYHGTEGAGIVAYAKSHATFPHETTGDQFFSESQFESYRTLGFEIMDDVLDKAHVEFKKASPGATPSVCQLIGILKDSKPVKK